MLRVALIDIFMFALPFLLYGAWVFVSRRAETPHDQSVWRDAPFLILAGIGVVFVVATMAVLISFSGVGPGGVYVPPVFDKGVVKPGHVE